ncbi:MULTISPECIES: YgjV family protein [Alteromonadaceae]|uniref:YgjV family protein n=1 Tax=Alteromonadaceae TaxID=72275 RepID=UPI001C0A614F|nr:MULTISPECIES: YgjV family protein [Aliiglaciecola]MBU2876429.1 YgjV family protein [Aliiglaciecola lipolytica]MDO6712746.1 YgjV family protein [Aliiglaciecola sp. 2_MG-2023]MDO6753855.1 YgjV family protein [Aliiglaciecola sp. 1_MG-2023]
MPDFLLSQVLVTFTLTIECFAMQLKDKNRLLALLSVSCLFNGFHYLLLDQPTAGYIFLFSSFRFLLSIKWKFQWMAAVSLVVSLFITVYTYIGFLSILGFAATVFVTTGSFSHNDKFLRIMMILGGSLWLIHNIILWSPVGILVEIVFVGSSAVGFYRYYIARKLSKPTV